MNFPWAGKVRFNNRDASLDTEAGAPALTAAISEKPDLIILQIPDPVLRSGPGF
jgi:hypothetical protein